MDITSNPWVITDVDVAAGPVTVWQYKCFILNIELEQYAGANSVAVVNQFNGKSFAALHGAADLQTVRTGSIGHADGIVVPQGGITAPGTLRIYHR